MADWALTVQELNEYVRKRLAGDPMLRGVRVRGEISGYKLHYSGHRYFILKDEASRINCVMFRQNALGLTVEPKNGDKVTLTGQVALFVRDGAYQFYVDSVEQEGAGALFLQFEQLKRRLMAEGLFDPSLKKPLPAYPHTIGIVTSETGAAVRDMIRVAKQRNPGVGILIRPAQVQGDGAAQDIANGIAELNANGRSDVILVGRGGGSMEELWAFNEEIVARAIFASRIPVVSCVGHEVDTTIADFVADVRAATPSQAAELAVPVRAEIDERLDMMMRRADGLMAGRRQLARARLEKMRAGYALSDPRRAVILERRQRLEAVAQCFALQQPRRALIEERRAALEKLRRANALMNPQKTLIPERRRLLEAQMNSRVLRNPRMEMISPRRERLQALGDRLQRAYLHQRARMTLSMSVWREKLAALNPGSVLERGYAAVFADGRVVESTQNVKPGMRLDVRLADGRFGALVTDVTREPVEKDDGLSGVRETDT